MLAPLLISFAVLLILRIPVAAAMGISGAIALLSSDMNLPLAVVPQRIFVMLDSTSLLAIPFFILAGAIMERGGMARRMIHFAQTMVGHWKGGLAQVDVLASTIFSSLTGSSAASASATGSILIPAMKRAGYPAGYAAALEASSASIGPIIPPSIIMVIYGSLAGVSVGAMFLSGIIPGLLITLGLFAVNAIMARRHGWGGGERSPLRARLIAGRDASAALLAPVIIIGGILGGVFTPTEAGAVAVVYSAIVGVLVYREVRLTELFGVMREAAITTGIIGLIIASAGIFGWVLALEQVPQLIVGWVQGVTDSPTLAVLLVIGFVLVIGCVVDVTAAVIILVPVFAPLGVSYGFDPVHFGVIICMALVYGNVTPPVGLLLFLTAAIAKCSVSEVMRYQVPFYIVLTVALGITVAFPALILCLTKL
ncbi:TRAP transporter large permease [Oceanicola sp. 502str15]|uniref:TRAP transporter large permease n=1 Tax=Oceanicola sp. 502str15 TaxID=2696061 RepID=UPI0020941290|nr:TRAP transporter large permease [Oceanicola sp. 502str15]MCO6383268.1 TRAP transporter large permease subunit [Oceanicola sp. 502str15]